MAGSDVAKSPLNGTTSQGMTFSNPAGTLPDLEGMTIAHDERDDARTRTARSRNANHAKDIHRDDR